MERLTMVGTGGGISEKAGVTREMLRDRLAAYEDTGLEPEEIEAVLDKYGRGHTAKTSAMEELQAYRALGPIEELSSLVDAGRGAELQNLLTSGQSRREEDDREQSKTVPSCPGDVCRGNEAGGRKQSIVRMCRILRTPPALVEALGGAKMGKRGPTMEPIDRAAIMGALTSSEGQAAIKAMTGAEAYNYFLSLLCSVPAIDAAPVVHGRWVEYLPVLGAGDLQIRCSECGSTHDVRTRHCPNCGAPMDGGDGHEAG